MLVQFLAAPGVIDLSWGHPDPALLRPDLVAEATTSMLARHGADVLGYGASAGPGPLIDWLAGHLGTIDGRAPLAGELMVTAGVSQGLDLVLTLLARPGDAVLVPVPTYHLALRILGDHPVRVVPIEADEEGALPEALEPAAGRVRAGGGRPRLLYLVPTAGNPTGITLAVERRAALAAAAARADVTVVEDDVYRELAYDAPTPPSLWSMADPGGVVRLGSFSKTLAPGLRLGWLTADAPTVASLAGGGLLGSGGGIAHISAMVALELAQSDRYLANLVQLRAALRSRRDTLVAALREHVPELSFRVPPGGYFIWGRLPGGPRDGLRARDLLPVAERHGVSFLPGEPFVAGSDSAADRLRLAFTRYGDEELVEAARRLSAAVREAQAAR